MKRKATHDWWPPKPAPKSRDKNPVRTRMILAMAQTIGRQQAPHGTWDSWSPEGQANLLKRAEEELTKERDKIARDMAASNNWGDYDELPVTTVMDLEHHANQEMEANFRATEKAVNEAAEVMHSGIPKPTQSRSSGSSNPHRHHTQWYARQYFPKKKPR